MFRSIGVLSGAFVGDTGSLAGSSLSGSAYPSASGSINGDYEIEDEGEGEGDGDEAYMHRHSHHHINGGQYAGKYALSSSLDWDEDDERLWEQVLFLPFRCRSFSHSYRSLLGEGLFRELYFGPQWKYRPAVAAAESESEHEPAELHGLFSLIISIVTVAHCSWCCYLCCTRNGYYAYD
jgi:hypothetical protein